MKRKNNSTGRAFNPDIVICVHNAFDDVKVCIESIYKKTNIDFNLIVINDGSDKETTDFLRKVKDGKQNCILFENQEAIGYTKSANIGLKASTSEYVVLMNSDVIVTDGWLEQLIYCSNSNSKIGLVGPISNAASWQSVPNRFDSNGDWAINELPTDVCLDDFTVLIKSVSERKYPKTQLLNGVCTLIKRKVFDTIGFLDEENFPKGYGEENDFCLRAINAKFELAIDDFTYIFHAKSKSFGHETRRELSRAGTEVLVNKFGKERLQIATAELKENSILKELRSRINRELIDIKIKNSKKSDKKRRVIFLLPVAGIAGGIHSVFQEVSGMRLLNVDAKIATWSTNRESYYKAYPNVENLEDHFYFFSNYDELIHYCGVTDVVVATINHSVFLLKRIYDRYPNILPVYYVQDYEPFFFQKGAEDWKIAYDSYTYIPEAVIMAKTNWLCETVSQLHNIYVEKVSPSIDTSVYYPNMSKLESNETIKIVAMIRPSTPRRGAERTMRVLKRIKSKYSTRVEINIFGTSNDLLDEFDLELGFEYTNWELINRERVSSLLRDSDIFIDFSVYQAFGRTGLEAMSCGCAVIMPERGGANEYVVNGYNALLANTSEDESCYAELEKLVGDKELREKIKANAINDSAHYSIKRAALTELLLFNKYLKKKKRIIDQEVINDFSDADRFYNEEGVFRYDLVSVIIVIEPDTKISKDTFYSISQSLRKGDELIIVIPELIKSTQEIIESYLAGANYKFIQLSEHFVKSRALEIGAEISNNPFICFISPEILVPRNILSKLTAYNDKKNVSAVAPLLNLENSFQDIKLYSKFNNYSNIQEINNTLEQIKKDQLNICKTVSLNCLLLRKELYNRVGGFKNYNNFEFVELDFIWRLKQYGSFIGVVQSSYCYLTKSNQKKQIFDKQSIEEDKKVLQAYVLDYYGEENLLTPVQIWGIENLHFEDQNSDEVKENGNSQAVSIVILTYNSSKTIMQCIVSVNDNIRESDEVLIVDNNSEDDTEEIVQRFIKNKNQFKFITNNANLGFSVGTNVGIKASKNPFIILLNPDTVVSKNWTNNLLAHFNSPKVGAVGPISNYVAGLQKMELYSNENFTSHLSVDEVARSYEENNKGKSIETKLLIGFCIALKKSVLDKIGHLDENLFLGNDDLELSWRLRENGYNLKIATDTFIYHEGQQSFNTKPSEVTSRLVQESTDVLYNKLVEYYKPNKVPSSIELWDMDWFKPSQELLNLHDIKKITTIIVLTYNQLKFTKEFLSSLKNYTSAYQLVVVDNNSKDGTVGYLKELEKNNQNIKLILNDKNEGFPKAVNQALKIVKTEFVVLANNDVVLTQNWLSRLIEIANSNKEIGIVGPISNAVSGVQLDQNAKYNSIVEMHTYAQTVSEANRGQIVEFPRVAFLCTLIKREVIEKIGGLDERFSPGNFEDDDFCLRAQLAGFKTVIAKDVFIHHYGSVSFKKNGNDQYAERLRLNEIKFIEKWGSNPEGVWLKNEKIVMRSNKFPINSDLYIQSLERAFINIDDKEYDFALYNLKIALEKYNTSSHLGYENITQEDILNMAGSLALSKNELEEAKVFFEKQLEQNPNSSEACFGLGEVFKNANMLEESKTMFEWAIENNFENQNAKIRLIEVNQKLKLPEDHNSLSINKKLIEK